MKLRCFSLVDLSVVIGLILILAGASLIMFGRVTKGQRDTERLNSANQIFDGMQEYYQSNFRQYPGASTADNVPTYQTVILGKDNDAFLQIALGDKIKKLTPETKPDYGYVYIYSNDASQAAIIVRRLENGAKKCNTNQNNLPEIVKDYLTKDPQACYFRASS